MWEVIGSILVKYWVEFLLGLVVAAGTYMFKRYIRLADEERDRKQKEYYNKLTKDIVSENKTLSDSLQKQYSLLSKELEQRYDELDRKVCTTVAEGKKEAAQGDQKLQEQINSITLGLLSMQGKEFKDNCRKLLEPNHIITLDEWEDIDKDHEAYNKLGGNHKGDALFELVQTKFQQTIVAQQHQ